MSVKKIRGGSCKLEYLFMTALKIRHLLSVQKSFLPVVGNPGCTALRIVAALFTTVLAQVLSRTIQFIVEKCRENGCPHSDSSRQSIRTNWIEINLVADPFEFVGQTSLVDRECIAFQEEILWTRKLIGFPQLFGRVFEALIEPF